MTWDAPIKPMSRYQFVLSLSWMAGIGMVGGVGMAFTDLTGRFPWFIYGFGAVMYAVGLVLLKRSKNPDGCKLCTNLDGAA